MSNKYYRDLFGTLGYELLLGDVATDGTIQENNSSSLDKYRNFWQTNTNTDNSFKYIDAGDHSIKTSFGSNKTPLPNPNNSNSNGQASTILLAVVLIAFLTLKK